MQALAVNSEPTISTNVGSRRRPSANPAVRIVLTPLCKPFPKGNPLPPECTFGLTTHPMFTVLRQDTKAPHVVVPVLASRTTVTAPLIVDAQSSRETSSDNAAVSPQAPTPAVEITLTPQTEVVCGANKKLKFHLSGRDFNYSNFEEALLAAVFHSKPPEALLEILNRITTEDFTILENRIIVEAMLHIYINDGEVTTAKVLTHLKSTLEDYGPTWIDYVNRCASVAYNPEYIKEYIGKLQEASAIRRGDTFTRYRYSEAFCAGLLKTHLPQIKCVGEEWYVYDKGIWEVTERDIFSMMAMESMHPDHRQASRVCDLLDHVQRLSQVPRKLFFGAYKRVEDRIVINANNCVLETSPDGTVTPREHSPDDHFTLKLPADFDRAACCPEFEATLEYALPDEADRNLLQVFAGYMLYPGCEFQKALVCFGEGGNGKSTLLEGIGHVFGEFLCSAAGLEDLCKPSGYSLSMMRHTMLNLGSELNGTEIEESANFKKLVSGDTMLTRQIYCKPSLMTATCKLVFLTNHMPRFRGGSHAEMRRLRILRFDRKPTVEDPFLGAKIKAERSGILNWMLYGLASLLDTRAIPRGGDGAAMALEALNQSVDPVGAFVAERCKLDPAARVAKQTLLDHFIAWCEENSHSFRDAESFFFKKLYERYPELKPKGTGPKPTIGGKRLYCLDGIDVQES